MANYKCKVSFDGYDWRNIFVVQSPTGKRIYLECNGKWDDMSSELLEMVNKYQWCKEQDKKIFKRG